MIYNIYSIYYYYYYFYYGGAMYYGLRFSYDTYYFVNYIYSFFPEKSKIPEIGMELYEIEYKDDWNILKIY